jgi:DNA-binding MarR family transcriptional regulator
VLERVAIDFPWASPDAVKAHITLLRASAVYSETLAKLYGEIGLSTSRFNLLWLLYRTDGKRLSIGALADYMGITLPSITRTVNTLVADGWLYTEKGVADRRVTFVEPTPEGEARFAEVLGRVIQFWQDMWSDVSPEDVEALVEVMSGLRSRLLSRFLGVSGLAVLRAGQHQPEPT